MNGTIAQLASYPGLSIGTGFFERAYSTGSDTWPTARVRFTPGQIDPGILTSANPPSVAVAPIAVQLAVSISLIDANGQVILVGGRALVADVAVHSWQASGGDALDPEAWLLAIVAADLPPVISWATMMTAAASFGLLAAAP